MIYLPEKRELYTPKHELDDFLADKNAPINIALYKAMNRYGIMKFRADNGRRKYDVYLAYDMLFYFNEAYALCTKVSIDAHPESHFINEYINDLSIRLNQLIDQYFILSIAYVLLAVNNRVRKQYIGMLDSLFYYLNQNFKNFLKWSFVDVILTDYNKNQINRLDFSPKASFKNFVEHDPKLGMPKDSKESEALLRAIRRTVCEHMNVLFPEESEEKNTEKATMPQEQKVKAVTKGFTTQQICIFYYYLFDALDINFVNKTKSEWADLISAVSGFPKKSIVEKLNFQSRIRQNSIVQDITLVSQTIKAMFPDISTKMLREIEE